ncbi:MAG TPA: hypothetical protein VMF67_01655 [Rhizomicrobium sp.]|nr:hypothetical protein [Rhizomicrobium sp.]
MLKKQQEQYREPFQIEYKGKPYSCTRVVSGSRVLTQEIHVHGIGSKHDSANYGRNGHPMETMGPIARTIAREILDEASRGCPGERGYVPRFSHIAAEQSCYWAMLISDDPVLGVP